MCLNYLIMYNTYLCMYMYTYVQVCVLYVRTYIHMYLCSTAVVRIGFVETVYFVSEGVGLVEVCTAVLEGSLGTTLPPISFNTADDTATGEEEG